MLFLDRFDAGRKLAKKLLPYEGARNVIVLALPRGGVPVAYEVATAIGAPLDLFLVRKLGVPGHPELAMGAVASGGGIVWNDELAVHLHIPERVIRAAVTREQLELHRQQVQLRGRRPPPRIAGWTVILIDDGLATGSTMLAAVDALRKQGPRRLVVAVPVGAAETCDQVRGAVDEFVCIACPEDFSSVGAWYADFSQTPDAQVLALLADAAKQAVSDEIESASPAHPPR